MTEEVFCCLGCGENLTSIPLQEFVDEYFGCSVCGEVFYECDGNLWPCQFSERDVPGWPMLSVLPLKRACQERSQ
jgi:hypothetical protein